MFRKLLSIVRRSPSPTTQYPGTLRVTLEINSPDSHDFAYRQGVGMIQPYLRVHNAPHKSASTPDAQRELRLGIQILHAVTSYHPQNWNAHWIIGKAYQALGDHQAAYASFKTAFEIQRENADVAREFMFTCLHLGYVDEAIPAATHAVALKPTEAGLHANLALAYLIAGRLSEGLAACEESLRLDPHDAITKNVRTCIQDIMGGRRPQPRTLADLES